MTSGKWNISYPAHKSYGAIDYDFGTEDTDVVLAVAPDITFADFTVDDSTLPLEDGLRFGRDFGGGATVTFTATVLTSDGTTRASRQTEADAHDALSRFRRVWDAAGLRNTPGAVATLRSEYGGETRYMFGRPRRWAPASTQVTRQGITPIVFDFQMVDSYFYDVVQTVAKTAPRIHKHKHAKAPENHWSFKVNVGGTHATAPVIVIDGPITNPKVKFGDDFTVALGLTLSDDAQITIDPRKWERTVLRANGSSVSAQLDRASATLADMTLTPGHHLITASGTGTHAGRTKVTVRWRDAYGFV